MDSLKTPEFTDFIIRIITRSNESSLEETQEIRLVVEQNIGLFRTAFTSHRENHAENYQMLEFLGDSVIFSFITWYLYRRFPQLQECKYLGIITRLKGNLISTPFLAQEARDLGFPKYLNLAITNDFNTDAFMEDIFEAFIGALNLAFDNRFGLPGVGYGVCYRLLKSVFDRRDISLSYESVMDPKSALKELSDAHPELGVLEYVLDLGPTPSTKILLNHVVIGTGYGKNKKIQQPLAAKEALKHIKAIHGIEPTKNKFAQKFTDLE